MLKKIVLLFLFAGIFSLQAVEQPDFPKFSDFNNLIQETYDQNIAIFSQNPGMSNFLIKKPTTNELIQARLSIVLSTIRGYSEHDITAIAFYNDSKKLQMLKNIFEQKKSAFLLGADIHKTDQEIKNIFNITVEPIIIYYYKGEEIARSTNFDTNNVLQYIESVPSLRSIQTPTFLDLNTLIQEIYDRIAAKLHLSPGMSKFLPKKPITNELTQVRFLNLLSAIMCRSVVGITIVVFYNNVQEIKSLKKFIEQEKYAYLIGVDIHKTEQEIKSAFNITTEPTIIYFFLCKEVARSTNFDVKDVARQVDYHLNAYVQQM